MRILLPVCVLLLVLAAAGPALGYDVPPYLMLSGGLNHPQDIAYDVWNDLVYVADYGNNRVEKYRIDTSSGALVIDYGKAFTYFADGTNVVEITNIGYAYYTAMSSIIRKGLFPHFDYWSYSYPGTGETAFYTRSLTVDKDASLYIADERSHRTSP